MNPVSGFGQSIASGPQVVVQWHVRTQQAQNNTFMRQHLDTSFGGCPELGCIGKSKAYPINLNLNNDLSSLQDTDLNIEIPEDPAAVEIIEKTADEIRNVIPTRFVPINDAMFFKSYPPCEEGFERDLHGVCREVWD
ncbi:uncharacterized protein ACR2FA_002857 [Aphomia sociella]